MLDRDRGLRRTDAAAQISAMASRRRIEPVTLSDSSFPASSTICERYARSASAPSVSTSRPLIPTPHSSRSTGSTSR